MPIDIGTVSIAFAFGAIIGSFLNVVIIRTGAGVSLSGRSACGACAAALPWYTLVPLISYIALRGRCHACRAHISLQYPLIELITGVSVAGILYAFGVPASFVESVSFLGYIGAVSVLIVILGYDIRHTVIPDRFSYTFAFIALALLLVQTNGEPTGWQLLAGPVLFAPFYALWRISNGRWIGLGDGKLALGIGWLFGIAAGFSVVLIAVWAGAVYGLVIIAIDAGKRVQPQLFRSGKRRTMKSEIPFAPFLVVSAIAHITLPINAFSLIDLLTL